MLSKHGLAYCLDADEHSQRAGWKRLESHARIEPPAFLRDLGPAILDHVEYDHLQPNLIRCTSGAFQGIREKNTPDPLPLTAMVDGDH